MCPRPRKACARRGWEGEHAHRKVKTSSRWALYRRVRPADEVGRLLSEAPVQAARAQVRRGPSWNYPSRRSVWRGGQGWAFRADWCVPFGCHAQGSGWARRGRGLGRASVKKHAGSMRRGRIGRGFTAPPSRGAAAYPDFPYIFWSRPEMAYARYNPAVVAACYRTRCRNNRHHRVVVPKH